ncbi:MAG: hypothetical protein QNI95_11395 [Desulfobacterales bacterium]|nr:hypothetical protein [Desulfobacterales bacterium]
MFYLEDNGGRRSGIERRQVKDPLFIPERRKPIDRRQKPDRRAKNLNRLNPDTERRRIFFDEQE